MVRMKVLLNGAVFTAKDAVDSTGKEASDSWAEVCNKVDYFSLNTEEGYVVFNEKHCKDMIVAFVEEI